MDNDEKMEMGDFSSNLDGYSRSKGGSPSKDNVEGSHDRKIGLDSPGEEDEKQTGHPSHNASEEKMEEEMGKEKEGKDPIGKDDSQSKGVNEERMENLDISTYTQINTITSFKPRKEDDRRDEAKLSFLHIEKLKAKTSLKGDSQLYNELMALKKKMRIMQRFRC